MERRLDRVAKRWAMPPSRDDSSSRSRRHILRRAFQVLAASMGGAVLTGKTGSDTEAYTCDGCGTCSRINVITDPAGNRFCYRAYYSCTSTSGSSCVGQVCAYDQAYRC